jgi:hypothetical protein
LAKGDAVKICGSKTAGGNSRRFFSTFNPHIKNLLSHFFEWEILSNKNLQSVLFQKPQFIKKAVFKRKQLNHYENNAILKPGVLQP